MERCHTRYKLADVQAPVTTIIPEQIGIRAEHALGGSFILPTFLQFQTRKLVGSGGGFEPPVILDQSSFLAIGHHRGTTVSSN
ncbi:hypothetical protein SCFA_190055 [anaerobic digester metagenome]|jgi:hypothetical protein|uniref:Uncharacterized protein n=1 Tax=anaerobic digester metagenome TaxID=1263854 RepID=A0A485LXR8_9ZZZZ